jgi:hypothetical protein
MIDRDYLILAYPVIGLVFAIYLIFTDKLGDGTRMSGKSGAFLNVIWLWPVFLIAMAIEYLWSRKKK